MNFALERTSSQENCQWRISGAGTDSRCQIAGHPIAAVAAGHTPSTQSVCTFKPKPNPKPKCFASQLAALRCVSFWVSCVLRFIWIIASRFLPTLVQLIAAAGRLLWTSSPLLAVQGEFRISVAKFGWPQTTVDAEYSEECAAVRGHFNLIHIFSTLKKCFGHRKQLKA